MPERTRLKVKRIDRIAFVDKGDNPEAHITILKRAPDEDKGVVASLKDAFTKLKKAMEDALTFGQARGQQKANEELWRFTDALQMAIRNTLDSDEANKIALIEQSVDEFAAAMKEAVPQWAAGKPVEKKETGEEPMADGNKPNTTAAEPAEDAVTKADIEAMQKRADELEKRAREAEERVAKLEVEKREQAFAKKVAGWEHLPVKADTFAPIMRKIADALTDDEMGEVERVLAASNEAARTAGLFEEAGASGGAAEGSALAKAEARASELRKADPKLSKQAALGQVYKQDPALRREVEDEEAAARAAR